MLDVKLLDITPLILLPRIRGIDDLTYTYAARVRNRGVI